MKLTVTGEKKEYEQGINIADLIRIEDVETPEYVTVSVNEELISRDEFESTLLQEDDEVEFLYFMGGGRA